VPCLPSPDVDPSLIEVVPWPHGYAHSWALAALLNDRRTAPAILAALTELPGPTPHAIDGPIERERRFGRARSDLAFVVHDASGATHTVAVETKVNDPFRAAQFTAYAQAGCVPLLFLPGLTGLLLDVAPTTDAGEIKLRPPRLLGAVDSLGLTFGAILNGYLSALRDESIRMDRAIARARGASGGELGDGQCPAATLEDVAWLAETYRALQTACAGTEIEPAADLRIEANDRGFFFSGSFTWVLDGSGLWVDVVTDVRTHRRSVAIKAGEKDVAAAWDLAAESGSGPSDKWRKTRRRVSGDTASVWKLDLDAVPAGQSADEAVRAAEFIRGLA
jgi:hypothetical protein